MIANLMHDTILMGHPGNAQCVKTLHCTLAQILMDPLHCSFVIIHLGSASILGFINSDVNV